MRTKVEIVAGIIALIVAVVFIVGYIHEREARAAFQAESRMREQAQNEAKAEIASIRSEFQQQFNALEKVKQTVVSQPQQAPQIIREYLPTPIQQTAPITKETLPDTPVAVLTAKNEVELAQFALACRQCQAETSALKAEAVKKDLIIDSQGKELHAAQIAIKGGTTKQKLVTALKWLVLGAGAGYVLHR